MTSNEGQIRPKFGWFQSIKADIKAASKGTLIFAAFITLVLGANLYVLMQIPSEVLFPYMPYQYGAAGTQHVLNAVYFIFIICLLRMMIADKSYSLRFKPLTKYQIAALAIMAGVILVNATILFLVLKVPMLRDFGEFIIVFKTLYYVCMITMAVSLLFRICKHRTFVIIIGAFGLLLLGLRIHDLFIGSPWEYKTIISGQMPANPTSNFWIAFRLLSGSGITCVAVIFLAVLSVPFILATKDGDEALPDKSSVFVIAIVMFILIFTLSLSSWLMGLMVETILALI